MRYTVPMPDDSLIPGRCGSAFGQKWLAGLDKIENRGRFAGRTVRRHGDGVRQRGRGSNHLDALDEVADECLSLRKCPILQ